MLLFWKHKKDDSHRNSFANADILNENSSVSVVSSSNDVLPSFQMKRQHLSFQCQLAHGSQTGYISEFKNIKELYFKIAECFDIKTDDILFCTLNTQKIDMDHLLGSQIGLDDFIFAHIQGHKKEIDFCKTDDTLGLTITDNGAGRAFIKRIRESSQISKLAHGLIDIGDHILKIDDEEFLGKRHFDVSKKLLSIEVGKKFTMVLISPEKNNNKSQSDILYKTPMNIVRGKKSSEMTGELFKEEITSNNMNNLALEAINLIVEKAIGNPDNEMAELILNIGKKTWNYPEFSMKLNEEVGECLFPKILLNELWAIITDIETGSLEKNDCSLKTTYTGLSLPSSTAYTNITYQDKY